jgi:hypothetical protein
MEPGTPRIEKNAKYHPAVGAKNKIACLSDHRGDCSFQFN